MAGGSAKIRIVNTLSIILIILAGATIAACAFLQTQPLKEKGSAPAAGESGGNSGQAWNGKYSTFLVCGIDNTNMLTDVIMLVSFDNQTHAINILQIPRDTYAGSDVPSYRYNAVYGHHAANISGMENLRTHVQKDFGIKANYYIAVTTKGLRTVVDAAGGVDLNVPINMNYDDSAQDLHIHLKKGYQHLNGSQAEQYVRYRKGWTQGDLGRLEAQKAFLAAFAGKLKSMGKVSLATKILPSVSAPDFLTDMTTMKMLEFALAGQKVDLSDVKVYTMPGEPFTYKDSSLYSVHRQELLKILNEAFVPKGTVLSLKDLGIVQMADTEKSASSGTNLAQAGQSSGFSVK